jgi:hypothetical protein
VTAWFRENPRAAGIGVTLAALALLGVAVALGWALFTREPPITGLGPSALPSASNTAPSPSASSPSALATSTTEPTYPLSSTLAFPAPAGILPAGSRAVVTLDGLRVREAPGLNAAVRDTLPTGTVVEVDGRWGPIVVDGIDWYWVLTEGGPLSGYVAASSGGVHYLDLVPNRCDELQQPDLASLTSHMAWERLACFGDRSLTVMGTYGCPVCGEDLPGTYEPYWLASPANLNYLGWPNPITLHFPPDLGLAGPANASIVRVTGHFSDPASTTCVISDAPGQHGVPVDPVFAEIWCREQFVVDSYEVLGTDPDFTHV